VKGSARREEAGAACRTTVPAPDACPRCQGTRQVDRGEDEFGVVMAPCEACCCAICGDPTTDTAPVCAFCDIAEETSAKRRSDR
jgi:hypothetical protein